MPNHSMSAKHSQKNVMFFLRGLLAEPVTEQVPFYGHKGKQNIVITSVFN